MAKRPVIDLYDGRQQDAPVGSLNIGGGMGSRPAGDVPVTIAAAFTVPGTLKPTRNANFLKQPADSKIPHLLHQRLPHRGQNNGKSGPALGAWA